jgi:hypothetical protein
MISDYMLPPLDMIGWYANKSLLSAVLSK